MWNLFYLAREDDIAIHYTTLSREVRMSTKKKLMLTEEIPLLETK